MVIETARPENAEAIFGIYLEGWLEVYPNTRLGITKDQVLERQIGRDGSLLAVRVAYWLDKIAAADEKTNSFGGTSGRTGGGFRLAAYQTRPEAPWHLICSIQLSRFGDRQSPD